MYDYDGDTRENKKREPLPTVPVKIPRKGDYFETLKHYKSMEKKWISE